MGVGDMTVTEGVMTRAQTAARDGRLNASIAMGECCTPTKHPMKCLKALFTAFGLTPPRGLSSGSALVTDGLWVKGSKFKYKMATLEDEGLSSPLNRFQRANVLRESKANAGPFRATQIWNEVILHLKERVELKRRRHKMRHYNNCFTGTDAVDVVLHYLLSDQDTFSSSLSRDKAIKLCQTLMDKNVFEPVSARTGEVKRVFEDSSGKYYRFYGEDKENSTGTPQPSDTEDEVEGRDLEAGEDVTEDEEVYHPSPEELRINPDDEPDLIGDGVICNPVANHHKQGAWLHQILEQRRTQKRKNSENMERCSKRARLAFSMEPITEEVNTTELESVWKEVALCQLLTIIDLPFLDGVLTEDKPNKKTPKKHQQALTIPNVHAKQWNTLSDSGCHAPETFMRTAIDCIGYIPQGHLLMLNQGFTGLCQLDTKSKSFRVIRDYYSSRSEPIFPDRFIDLHLAIMNLVLEERDSSAIQALQLDMVLLPQSQRDELHRLLRFMAAVAEDKEIELHDEENNEHVVLLTFTDAILKHKLLAKNLAVIFIGFFMHHVDEIFLTPESLRERVDLRLWEIKNGQVSPLLDTTFCSLVTSTEYQRQTEDCTNTSLVQMMNSILDNTKMTLKDKKQRMRQFCKHHPHLYAKHFSGMV